jgi:pimeloyl-ACP methyl ester carboxylesterase
MFVLVNGVRLFVEVLGSGLAPDGPRMLERPTIVALHGGPSDHAHMRDMIGPLADVAQVVLYDHRGCGRSEAGDPALWTYEQWGDDVRGLCDALGLERPIVFGVSFGGFIAQSYATRHPGHAERLVLASTGPRLDLAASIEGFRQQGGDVAADTFAASLDLGRATPQTLADFMTICRPLYTMRRTVDHELNARQRMNPAVAMKFFADWRSPPFDFSADLAKVTSPVLILGGDEDPITPPVYQDALERALRAAPRTRLRFPGASHFIHLDAPDEYFAALRGFVGEGRRP